MLNVIANALRSPSRKIIQDGFYQNENGEWGYYVTIWDAGHYHMISVSHITDVPTPEHVACAITSPAVFVKDDGRYRNSQGRLGYWATIQSGAHWYMLSVSDMLEPYHKQWWSDRLA